jgi:hypothetical protein
MDDDSTYVIINKPKEKPKELYINMNNMNNLNIESIIEVKMEETSIILEAKTVEACNVSESSLTEDQKKLAAYIYDSTKSAVQSFISDRSINNTIKITMTIGQLIKQLEYVKIAGKAPTGADKKTVAIQLGRILIKEVAPDDKEIFIIYDLIAEPTLEAMIDVSKVVNVEVKEIVKKCCPRFSDIFK